MRGLDYQSRLSMCQLGLRNSSANTTAVHTAQTRLHQTLHDSLLVDMVGRVRSNGAQRLACIAASA